MLKPRVLFALILVLLNGSFRTQDVGTLQAQDRPATFEVTSIRISKSTDPGFRGVTKGRSYTATNIPLRYVIAAAYNVPVARVVGGPSWLGEPGVDLRFTGGDRFDISATLPEGAPASQVPVMLRALLADRFKLIAQNDIREAPMYALVPSRTDGRLGPQLRKADIDCDAARAAGQAVPAARPGERGLCATEIGDEMVGRGQSLGALARMLSLFAGRPVVDRTGLSGGYDFDLRFPELNAPAGGRGGDPNNDSGGGIFVAVQEQLGLTLEPIRGPLEFVVVDSVARPTEN
jgi:uncharacterized protein (TIGR03435 family)